MQPMRFGIVGCGGIAQTHAQCMDTLAKEGLAVLVAGALGSITGTTLAYPGLPQRVLICGSEGSASFQGDDMVFFNTKRPFEYDPPADLLPTPSSVAPGGENKAAQPLALFGDYHTANYRNFIRSVRAGVRPLVTGEDQYKVCRVLNLIYERAGVGPYWKR